MDILVLWSCRLCPSPEFHKPGLVLPNSCFPSVTLALRVRTSLQARTLTVLGGQRSQTYRPSEWRGGGGSEGADGGGQRRRQTPEGKRVG